MAILLCSIIGISGIYILTSLMEIPTIRVNDIDYNRMNEIVNVTGFVNDVKFIKNGIIVDMKDGTGNIRMVVWDSSITDEQRQTIKKGKKINAICEIKMYKNQLELVALKDKIKIIDE